MALNKKQRERLPSTLARSPKKAQNTYIETLEAAEKQHGDGEAAHRIALASLKYSFEKVGDHWERKQKKGPSDSQDAKRGKAARRGTGRTAGGVDAFASKAHLTDVAKRLDIKGRSKMKKAQLVKAIDPIDRPPPSQAASPGRPEPTRTVFRRQTPRTRVSYGSIGHDSPSHEISLIEDGSERLTKYVRAVPLTSRSSDALRQFIPVSKPCRAVSEGSSLCNRRSPPGRE